MVNARPSKTAAELEALLDDLPDDDRNSAVFGLDELSTLRLLEDQGAQFHVINARFTGDLPAAHEIGVREATAILGELQEIVSEVGAVLRAESPRRGPLPADVIRATELRLSPRVRAGSVIFSMHPPRDEPLFDSGHDLLGDALDSIFSLFDKVELPASSGVMSTSDVADALRTYGPRTARHLVKFAEALQGSGLNMDLGVAASGRPVRGSRISRAGAGFLQTLASEATSRTLEVELLGSVRNLGTDNRHRFIDDDRGLITMTADAEVTGVLYQSWDRSRVRVYASETESVTSATGATTYRYHAVRAELLDEQRSTGFDNPFEP